MEPAKVQAITVNKPLVITHENSLLYTSLKQCMANNEELRQALLDAAQTISALTEKLREQNESKSTTT